MSSAFQDEWHGFSPPLADDELKTVYVKRKEEGKKLLMRSPRLRSLDHGKSMGACWGYDLLKEHVMDMAYVYEHQQPDVQFVNEVDHSSGHAKQ
ncbi:unnamed protein product [Hapterophycus canaliculatus]